MLRIATLVLLVVLPAAVLAQTDSHIAAAKELLMVTKSMESTEQAFESLYPLINSMSEHYPMPDEHRDALTQQTQATMEFLKQELSWTRLEPHLIQLYVDVYTEEELRGLTEFYESPLGQAFIEKNPKVMEASAQMTMELMRDLIPKLQQRREEMRAEREASHAH